MSFRLTREQALSFLRFATEEQLEKRKTKWGADLGFDDVLDLGIDLEGDQEEIRRTLERVGFSLSEHEAIDFLSSRVPPEARRGFYECMSGGQALYLTLERLDYFTN
ncbi:MAG TPA: hypothetical protein VFX95_02465, partial [Caulobacteraceae bacterium]|nr:hypothetical protein [Caulobacteraceae bacterium]